MVPPLEQNTRKEEEGKFEVSFSNLKGTRSRNERNENSRKDDLLVSLNVVDLPSRGSLEVDS